MSNYKIFNDAFLINLDSRLDRLEYATKELNKVNIKFNRVSGKKFSDKKNFPYVGSRGCFESHKSILVNNVNNDHPILIMEDDILFTKHFKKIHWYFDKIPQVWDILFFYNSNTMQTNKLWNKSGTIGAHFYIVNNKSITKILYMLYDGSIDQVYQKLDISSYCTNEQMVIQNYKDFGSNITTSTKKEARVRERCKVFKVN